LRPAPLLSIPQAPAPQGGEASWVEVSDGTRQRAALFPARGKARGSVVVAPGRTEPLEKYYEVIEELRGRGFAVLVYDLRGQGLSSRFLADRERGHARGWRRFMKDFDAVLKAYEARLPRPWIALGHSMGGALMVLALAEGEPRFAAAVLSAPMLGLRFGNWPEGLVRSVAWFMTFIGRASEYVYPLEKRLEERRAGGSVLTHDAARWTRYEAQLEADPKLRLGGVTWGWLAFATAVTFRIARLHGVEKINVPLVVVGAERDLLCTTAAQMSVAARAPWGRYVEVEGAFHEILMETDPRRAVFWGAFDAVAEEVAG
jgi:lysophospholipase